MQTKTTICAIATAPGRGGVGIVRVSGPKAKSIAEQLIGFTPKLRHAHFCDFKSQHQQLIDEGICIFFAGPHSFTGEDVVEFQAHGGPVILDLLLEAILQAGAIQAKPGEFSERAFLNDKLDLVQAEAIADLIAASSRQAAQQAINSLQGNFSKAVNELVDQLIQLRIYVEAAIDFPEEEVDFLTDGKVSNDLTIILEKLTALLHQAQQGNLVREGMKIVIAGRPNAGKSSLLNALTEKDIAIVSDIAGTTRDVLREQIHIDGMPLHLIDTAGLRDDSHDVIEQIGIKRAQLEIAQADRILLVVDATQPEQLNLQAHWPEFFNDQTITDRITIVLNKVDIAPTALPSQATNEIQLSAKTGAGISKLRQHLKQVFTQGSRTLSSQG